MRKLVWLLVVLLAAGTRIGYASEFVKIDDESSIRVEEWWRVEQDDGSDRVFFNATFRNDGTSSGNIAGWFDYRLTLVSGDTYPGTPTASECFWDFGWDPWSNPCGDSIKPGGLGEVVIAFRNVKREGYPSRLTLLVRDQETVASEFNVSENGSLLLLLVPIALLGASSLVEKERTSRFRLPG
jgi:hypothetical protein